MTGKTETEPKNRFMRAKTLHELLYVAIEDFQKSLKNPRFKVDMGDWLTKPSLDSSEDGRICYGCLAGACLVAEDFDINTFFHEDIFDDRTLRIELNLLERCYPGITDRMYAIDCLRTGRVGAAYCYFYNAEDSSYGNRTVSRYGEGGENKAKFLHDLIQLHKFLEKEGI